MGGKVALFDSWRGSYSDSPRALSERMAEKYPEWARVWVLRRGVEAPKGVRSVRPFSLAHLYFLARANVVFANNAMPSFWRKRKGCTYIQTWHGTPLKRIAWDVANPQFKGGEAYLRRFARDVAKWDYLIAPNPDSADIFQRAFRYSGKVLLTGYPRNDLLLKIGATTAASVRAQLGLRSDQRVILYAPTWREKADRQFDLHRELHAWERGLQPGEVLLIRAHPHDKNLAAFQPTTPAVTNVTTFPDVQELLAIADVLVTDYSSVMFDYGVTRRPMVFFTYDLAHYRDELRGFYFDFDTLTPGPTAGTVDELLAALRQQTTEHSRHRDFVQRFCALEDGQASDRVLEQVLGAASN